MVINGQAVKGAKRLANHLMKDENEKVSILEISGTVANDNLHFAFRDMEDIGKLTKSQSGKVLYHANINPRKNEALTPEQYIKACDTLMEKLGFDGQPRAIVMHQKQGRQHAHLVVQLTDIEKGKLKTISNNYYKHKEVSRSLEKEFELAKTHEKKTGRSYSQSEAQQAQKLGKSASEFRKQIQACYIGSSNGKQFFTMLSDKGVLLAKGKRLIVIDQNGTPQSLTRVLKPVANARQVKTRIKDIENDLPKAENIQRLQKQLNNRNELKKTEAQMQEKLKSFKTERHLLKVEEEMINRLDYYKKRLGEEKRRNDQSREY